MNSFPTLYKRTEIGQIQEWTITVDDNKYFTTEGIQGGKMTQSLPTICSGKNIGKKNETSGSEQAYKEAAAIYRKKIEVSGYCEFLEDIDNDSLFFKPMLAKNYDDLKDTITFPCYAQPKLDGHRCILTKDKMQTRNGKTFVSAPHILEIFNDLLNSDYIFDGELYAHEYKEDFDEISSLIKKTKPTNDDLKESREKIQYWIYDLPSSDGVFSKRLETLKRVLSKINNKSIVLVETRLINNQKELDDYFDELVEMGYEGQIIRFDLNKYENKRTKQLWKRKEFQDEEFKILDICEGKGNRVGMVGYMRFKTKEGKEFTSDLKAKHERLKYVWEHRNEYIGKIAKVKFFKLTPDGLPRFPKVIEIDRQDI